jgi:hypothetical protein
MGDRRAWLALGGVASAAASLLHLASIAGGPDWYRFFGAGEPIARAAERGSWVPALLALAIATLLAAWSAFAFSGAGLLRPLPLLRTALVAITAIYLVRGLALFFPTAMSRPDLSPAFLFWSSLIVLAIGVVHLVGLWRAWPLLRGMH